MTERNRDKSSQYKKNKWKNTVLTSYPFPLTELKKFGFEYFEKKQEMVTKLSILLKRTVVKVLIAEIKDSIPLFE